LESCRLTRTSGNDFAGVALGSVMLGARAEYVLRFAAFVAAALVFVVTEASAAMSLTLTSSAFEPGGMIPSKYTCEGEDISPPLAIAGVPEGTKSLALIEDDPDAPDPKAPKVVWVHWLLYNLPPDTDALPEGAGSGAPAGATEGINNWKRTGYGGPCPPIGRHRYFHKLYALDTTLPDKPMTKDELEAAMKGHILAQAELMGTYQKGDP
jgi:Raf kinase inhibitor-like YbhB/YbcL family protein